MLYLALFTMVVMIVEQEFVTVFDRETRLFRVQTLLPSVLKGVISALTALQCDSLIRMLLPFTRLCYVTVYLLYDYYQYLIAGHKKVPLCALVVSLHPDETGWCCDRNGILRCMSTDPLHLAWERFQEGCWELSYFAALSSQSLLFCFCTHLPVSLEQPQIYIHVSASLCCWVPGT